MRGNVADVGVDHGKLFILLCLLRSPKETAVAVDLFEDQDRNVDQSGAGNRERLTSNIRHHADMSGVIFEGRDSLQLDSNSLISVVGGRIRLFSIDGGRLLQ